MSLPSLPEYKTGESQYLAHLRDILDYGDDYADRTGVGRRGLWQLQIRVDMALEYPLITTKRVAFRWLIEELLWMISGSTYEPHLSAKGVDIWKEWATAEQAAKINNLVLEPGDLGPTYGHHWRNFGGDLFPSGNPGDRIFDADSMRWLNPYADENGVDQLAVLMDKLDKDPYSTHHLITAWNPMQNKVAILPPCPILYHFKVTPDGRLHSFLYQRSCDMFLGVPFNLAAGVAFSCLIAHAMGLLPGEFVHQLGDAHLYANHLDAARTQVERRPYDPPMLKLSDSLYDGGLRAVTSATSGDFSVMGYAHHPKLEAEVAV